MNGELRAKFLLISAFLKEYEYIHRTEFLKKYPHPYSAEVSEWIQEISAWNFSQLAQLESFPLEYLVRGPSLKNFLQRVAEYSKIPQKVIAESSLPLELQRKLSVKKKHEIQTLKTLVDSLSDSETIIDVGGGAGHLSCALTSGNAKKAFSIDRDPHLQEMGKKKIMRWARDASERVQFLTHDFDDNAELGVECDYHHSTLVGLHSCGPLSVSLLKFAVRKKVAKCINFPCCYQKIVDEYNISSLAQIHGLALSSNALHLAARSYAVVSAADLETRLRVKSFRYTLHYFLHEHFDLPFTSVGNARKADYCGKFCDYARKYHRGPELEGVSDQMLEDFFAAAAVKQKVWSNFLADSLRVQLGRVIEIYLLLDRVIYLQERGVPAQIFEVFDRSLSPRNIMLTLSQ